jgi:hypothetical protein
MSDKIKKFTEFEKHKTNEKLEYPLSNMDDISGIIIDRGLKKFSNSTNNNIICESSLSRLLEMHKRGEWAIITAYRTIFTKEENIKRNRKLRGILNDNKLGVHQLVGRWAECTLPGVPYDKCPKDSLVESFERSYFISKPENIDSVEFKNLMLSLMTIDGETQDAIVYCDGKKIHIMGSTGQIYDSFDEITLNKISQAYSRHLKKHDIPFVFEGLELPGSISGKMVMQYENIKYLI